MIGDHVRAGPPRGSSIDDVVETVFAPAILQTADFVAPSREHRLSGSGWRGDAQPEANLNMAITARCAASMRHQPDAQDSQLMRAVR